VLRTRVEEAVVTLPRAGSREVLPGSE
jgi:hypothetical protein